MKIGLISDTHSPQVGLYPPEEVERAFAGVDLILHAGDIYSVECLDWLERIAPVLGVEVAPAPVVGDRRVVASALWGPHNFPPETVSPLNGRVIEAGGYAIGLSHDLILQGMDEILPGKLAAKFPADRSMAKALELPFGRSVDIVVFGHTHRALVETCQGVLFVNPGSTALPNQIRRLGTVAMLELSEAGFAAEIIELSRYSV